MKCVLRSPACCGPPTRAESSAAPVVGMLKCDMRRAALVPVSPGCSLDQGLFSPSCLLACTVRASSARVTLRTCRPQSNSGRLGSIHGGVEL